jgi:hypothetical protein
MTPMTMLMLKCILYTAANVNTQVPRLEGVRSTYKRQTGYQLLIADVVTQLGRNVERAIEACMPLIEAGPDDEATAAAEVHTYTIVLYAL